MRYCGAWHPMAVKRRGLMLRLALPLRSTWGPAIGGMRLMDTIFIKDLRIDTVIGIYDWEREIKQTVALDLEMDSDIGRAAESDEIADTLNYKAVAKRLIEFIEGSKFQLVEALAEECATLVRSEFQVPWLRLTVNKPGAVTGAESVGVIIERGERA